MTTRTKPIALRKSHPPRDGGEAVGEDFATNAPQRFVESVR